MPSAACTCFPVPEQYWTTHYGAVEPGSMMEYNPECPEHGDRPAPLAAGRLAVRHDPRPLNPSGWAVLSNEPVSRWSGARRAEGEPHAGLYAYPFKSWASAVRRAHQEGERRKMLAKMAELKQERPMAAEKFVYNGAQMFDRSF